MPLAHRCQVLSMIALAALASATQAQGTRPVAEPALPASLPAEQIEVLPGITFATPGKEVLKLDLARPKTGHGPRPAVVCIYGGGWISGSRSGMQPFIRFLAAHGYVAVAPTYRLAPKYRFPAAVADVRQCVRWLRKNAREYDIDPKRIGAMGLSAGGHLSLMLGVTSDEDRFGDDDKPANGESARVQAVVNYFGPADLAAKDWSPLAVSKYLVPFLNGTAAERPEEYRRASPLMYVSRDDPPMLTFHGNKDLTVPISQSVLLHKRLDAAGVKNRLVILEGQGHGWREPHLGRTMRQMVAYFDDCLKKTPPAATTRPHDN